MALSTESGPFVTTGSVDTSQNRDGDVGPNLEFQGSGVFDPRFALGIGTAPGRPVYGVYANPYLAMADTAPTAPAAARVVASAAQTGGTACALVGTQGTGLSPSIPIIPFGSAYTPQNVVTAAQALDFGFTTCNTTSGSASIVIPSGAWRQFKIGQNLIISGAGGTNIPLLASVAATPAVNATAVTLSTTAKATVTGAQVGTADPSGVAAWPFAVAGTIALGDPTQLMGRVLSAVSANAGDTAVVLLVTGWDCYGQPMTDVLSLNGTTTVYGKKAFKYIKSIVPYTTGSSATVTANLTGTAVTSLTISAGSGFAANTTTPVFGIVSGGTGSGLVVGLNLNGSGGVSTSNYTIYNAGNYTVAPTVTVVGGVTGVATAGNISVGVSDMIGLSIRCDYFEYMSILWNSALITSSTGLTVADATSPAYTTAGDPRGTIQLDTANGSGTGISTTAANGKIRFAAFTSLPVYNAINSNSTNYVTLFGATQA